MKTQKYFIYIGVCLMLLIGCKKDEIHKTSSLDGEERFLSALYDPEYIPEGDIESKMQLFFDNVNEYVEYPDSSEFSEYPVSEGIWYLLTSLNYTCADAFSQIADIEEYEFEIDLEFSDTGSDMLSGNGVFNAFVSLHQSIQGIYETGYRIGAIYVTDVSSDDEGIHLQLSAIRGEITIYPEVDLEGEPTGIPNGALLMMGTDGTYYKSAAKETEIRYNPYLYYSKISNINHTNKYYLLTNVNGSLFFGWTDSDNCWNYWPNGDHILYSGANASTYLTVQINGEKFNTYLSRFFQKKMNVLINNNLYPSGIQKCLYLRVYATFLPEVTGVPYIFPYNKSSLVFRRWHGDVLQLTNTLNTYQF